MQLYSSTYNTTIMECRRGNDGPEYHHITQTDMSTEQVQELVGMMEKSVQAVKVTYRIIKKLFHKTLLLTFFLFP